MTGKQKCAILREIRRDIAEKNDISIRIEECTHKGACRGTCPRCEAEVRALEKALELKKKRGIQTAVAGVSAGILAASLVSCTPVSGAGPEETQQPETAQAEQIDGELVPGDENGETEEIEALAGDVLAVDLTDDGDEECVELEGEPPVEDYEEEYPPLAGILPAEDYTIPTEGEDAP